jgi:hypothetical protein
MRQQQGIAYAVRQVVHAAQLVCHRMHIAKRSIVERHARQEFGIGHLFARFQILAVFHGGAQVLGISATALSAQASVMGVAAVET